MADQEEVYRFVTEADPRPAETLRRRFAELKGEVADLKILYGLGGISLDQYKAKMHGLGEEARKLKAEMKDLDKAPAGRLTGADRKGAQIRGGMLAANIIQDAAYNPLFAVNNVIGAAGDKGVRSLAAEYGKLAVSGGKTTVALTGTAAAAGILFKAIDEGLKRANLEWSDFDNVVANTAPWKAVEGAIGAVIRKLDELGVDDAADKVAYGTERLIYALAESVLGWDKATDAAGREREELRKLTADAKEAEEALKRLAGFQSREQQRAEKRGKLVGQELANLGGAGGIEGLRRTLLPSMLDEMHQGAGDDVTRNGETKKASEWADQDLKILFGRATEGDRAALDRILKLMDRTPGFDKVDRTDLGMAATGVDPEEHRKEVERIRDGARKATDDARDEAERARKKVDEDAASALQDRYTVALASGAKFDVAAEMARAGLKGRPDEVRGLLDKGSDEAISRHAAERGGTFGEAAADLALADEERRRRHAAERSDRVTRGTGFDDRAELAMARSMTAGGTPGQIVERVAQAMADEFMAGGMKDRGEALLAGREKARGLYDQAMDEAIGGALRPDREDLAGPRTLNALDVAGAVQAGQKNPVVDELQQHKQYLERIAQNTANRGFGMGP